MLQVLLGLEGKGCVQMLSVVAASPLHQPHGGAVTGARGACNRIAAWKARDQKERATGQAVFPFQVSARPFRGGGIQIADTPV